MKKLLLLIAVLFSAAVFGSAAEISGVQDLDSPDSMPFRIGGGGGAFFYVKPGNFEVDVFYYGYFPGRAILAAPDREIVADVWFPGTSGKDVPAQYNARKISIKYNNKHEGVFSLVFIPVNDWYGDRMQWAFTTNCPKYVIELSKAHRDARHLEPLIFKGSKPGKIVFPAAAGEVKVEISKAYPGSKATLSDPAGSIIASAKVNDSGKAELKLAADAKRTGLYTLQMDRLCGILDIDELTRWERVQYWQNSAAECFWTNNADSWFDMAKMRMLVVPYYKEIYLDKGSANLVFRVKNYTGKNQKYSLSVEYPDGEAPFISLNRRNFEVKGLPRNINDGINNMGIIAKVSAPEAGKTRRAIIRCTVDGMTSYSTVVVHGKPAAERPAIELPYKFKPYRNGEDYSAKSSDVLGEPYFDHKNSPVAFDNSRRPNYFKDGKWHRGKQINGSSSFPRNTSSKIAFDGENRAYYTALKGGKVIMLWSKDGGAVWEEAAFPVDANMADIEVFNGHNTFNAPPAVLLYKRTSGRAKNAFWRATNDMYLVLPEVKNGKLTFPTVKKISSQSIGTALHSGLACSLASKGDNVYIIWGEASDPNDKSIKGVPTYVTSYNRKSGKVAKSVLIGFGPPANDVHNTPSLIIDGKGYLHGIIGSHGLAFRYARSLKPEDISAWTEDKPLAGERGGMTYVGAICDKNNDLQLICRQYRGDPELFKYGYCSELVKFTKKDGSDVWGDKKVFACPVFNDYSVYYHRVSIDREGTIYLSMTYWSTYWFYRNDFDSSRIVIYSKDCGKTWYLCD